MDQAPRWIDRHSINCYRCCVLVDERECVPNTAEFGGTDDGGELCPRCHKLLMEQKDTFDLA